ncbi:MAG: RNA polymerase subunit sigma-70, partial [Polyangiaceae bacterium]
ATNACLNALESAKRRELPSGLGHETTAPDAPFVRGEVPWLEPFPDADVAAADPLAALVARGTLRLALVAAMQHLPARQRAVLILRDVLDWPAADVAVALETTTTAVNSALDRARATLERAHISVEHVEDAGGARTTLDRYVAAFERADVAALRALLAADVVLEMPPMLNWMIGPGAYGAFIERVWTLRGREWKSVRLSASGQAAFAAYVRVADGTFVLHTLQVFEIGLGGIARNTTFQDAAIFARFGLQPSL